MVGLLGLTAGGVHDYCHAATPRKPTPSRPRPGSSHKTSNSAKIEELDRKINALVQRSNLATHQGRVRESLRLTFQMVDLDPTDLEKLDDLAFFLDSVESHIEDPTDPHTFSFSSQEFSDLGGLREPELRKIATDRRMSRRQKAIAVYEWAVARNPNDPETHWSYARHINNNFAKRPRNHALGAESRMVKKWIQATEWMVPWPGTSREDFENFQSSLRETLEWFEKRNRLNAEAIAQFEKAAAEYRKAVQLALAQKRRDLYLSYILYDSLLCIGDIYKLIGSIDSTRRLEAFQTALTALRRLDRLPEIPKIPRSEEEEQRLRRIHNCKVLAPLKIQTIEKELASSTEVPQ